MSWRDVVKPGWGKPCTQTYVRFPFFTFWDRVKRRRFKGCYVTVAKGSERAWKFLRRELRKEAPKYYRKMDDFADDWGQACRPIAGTDTPSNHAYGTAIDIDATKNYQGRRYQDTPIWKAGKDAIRRWERLGNRWGGRFSNPDGMHFEILLTPAQLKNRLTKSGKVRKAYREQVYGRG